MDIKILRKNKKNSWIYNKFLKKYIYCKYDIFLTIKLKLFYKFLNFLNINNMRKKETIFILKKKKIHIP